MSLKCEPASEPLHISVKPAKPLALQVLASPSALHTLRGDAPPPPGNKIFYT